MKKALKKRLEKKRLQARLSRFAGVDSKLNIETENLQKSLEKVLSVSVDGIRRKIASLPHTYSISDILTANEKSFQPFQGRYCNKTGKLIYKLSQEDFSNLLKIHSKQDALKLLFSTFADQYSIEWLSTDPPTLNKLSTADPCGYFVYAANYIFQTRPTKAVQEESFPVIPYEYKERFLRLQDKIKARQQLTNLNLFHSENIIQANELMRRLLGLCKPTVAMASTFFTVSNLVDATESKESLEQFIKDLKENISFLIRRHFNSIKNKTLSDRRKLYEISSSDIEAIKKELGGLTNFHHQASIKNQSKRMSIMLDLQDFVLNDLGENYDETLEADLLEEIDFSEYEQPISINCFKLDEDFMGLKLNQKLMEEKQKEKAALSFSKEKSFSFSPDIPENKPAFKLSLNIKR